MKQSSAVAWHVQQNVEYAVDEINRRAPDRRFVQVMLLVGSENTLGRRREKQPSYRHSRRQHVSPPMSPVGWPTGFTREYVNRAAAFQSQLTGLIAEFRRSVRKAPSLTRQERGGARSFTNFIDPIT